MVRPLAALVFVVVFSFAALGQSTENAPTKQPEAAQPAAKTAAFDVADVQMSEHRRFPYMSGGDLRGDRYMIRDATMVDLISTAYSVEADNVLGGPAWLETDRFDVIAKAPPTTAPDTLKLMLRDLLANRFKLVEHSDTKPMQVYVLSAGKGGKSKMKEAEGSENGGCQGVDQGPPAPGAIPQAWVRCKGMTMDVLAQSLHDMAGAYIDKPVVNSTGIEGTWDLELKWTPRGALARAGDEGISIFNAVDTELGLKLDLQKVPRPVIAVDSVNEKPTDNSPEVAKILPPAPPAEFDVAVIKPTDPSNTNLRARIDGGQLSVQGVTLKFLIQFAWDLNYGDDQMLVNAPKWIEADHWDILGKAAMEPPTNGKANAPQFTQEDLQHMLRALLEDRFQLKAHMEDRPISAYTLTADKPKLEKAADATARTRCAEGPGKDGKDPRLANPSLNRLITCQNMNMAEFSEMLADLAPGYIYVPVKNDTGLQGGYDFTLSFSGVGQLPGAAGGRGAAPPPTDGSASTPSGAISLIDAVNKELGLKLVKETRPAPVLVIDHLEQKPTDN